jgi:V8-like Glu-specific endopeptidase
MIRYAIATAGLLLAMGLPVFSQIDTMVVYDVRTMETDILPPPIIPSTPAFDRTGWHYGTHPGKAELSNDPPVITAPESGFTDFIPAQELFDVSDYPMRTAVKLFRFENGVRTQLCSGTMVSSTVVLTDAHCLFNHRFGEPGIWEWLDSVLVAPAFDNGTEHDDFGSSVGARYFIPKTWYDTAPGRRDDIALIELRDPIGQMTGWIGIAFNDDDDFFHNNLFHKFSYPGTVDPSDSTRVFTGDTLYYNYGHLDIVEPARLGYRLTGIPGQSGSSLFYTDNSEYYAFGTIILANNSIHYRIDRTVFYVFENILSDGTVYVQPPDIPPSFVLRQNFPNPFNPSTTISYALTSDAYVELTVYDVVGRLVRTLVRQYEMAGEHIAEWDGRNANGAAVASGVYYYRIAVDGEFTETRHMMLIR